MVRKMMIALVAVAAVIAGSIDAASARGGGHGGGGHGGMGHGSFGGHSFGHFGGARGFGFRDRFAFGAAYPYGYYDDCYTRVWTRWGWRQQYVCY
jgi:hypothetical protein